MISSTKNFKYLGHRFGIGGVLKPTPHNLSTWLKNASHAPLKPDQKLLIIKNHFIPMIQYTLQNISIVGKTLSGFDHSQLLDLGETMYKQFTHMVIVYQLTI